MLSYAATIAENTDKSEGGFLVSFTDLPNILTFGATLEEAKYMAEDALNSCLEVDFERGQDIPLPTNIKGLNVYLIPVQPHISLSIYLRQLRAERSQIEVAKKLGMSYQNYQRLENPRKANPTIKTLEKIAGAYGKRVEITFSP